MLGPDVVVIEQARFFLRQHDHSSGPISKTFEQRSLLETVGGTPQCTGAPFLTDRLLFTKKLE